MDKLKWTRVFIGDCWPATGLFLVRVGSGSHGGEGAIPGVKGEAISPKSIRAICGPLDIAEPDPELELPEGWWVEGEWPERDHSSHRIHASTSIEHDSYYGNVDIRGRTRSHCVRAVNAAVKALEEE